MIIIRREKRAAARFGGALGATHLLTVLANQPTATVMFAAAPSQDDTLHHFCDFCREFGVPWWNIIAFHMDEYVGPHYTGQDSQGNASFARYLHKHTSSLGVPKEFHYINGSVDPQGECNRLNAAVAGGPFDLVFCGIGRDEPHVAFNCPGKWSMRDPAFRLIELSAEARQQQVADRCFGRLQDVPTQAITASVLRVINGKLVICSVPGDHKRRMIQASFQLPLNGDNPAGFLYTPQAPGHRRVLLVDDESGADLPKNVIDTDVIRHPEAGWDLPK